MEPYEKEEEEIEWEEEDSGCLSYLISDHFVRFVHVTSTEISAGGHSTTMLYCVGLCLSRIIKCSLSV